MNSLLLPIKPEPDLDIPVFCEKCAGELTKRGSEQCPDCEMDFHPGCWWNVDYEFCLDCLLKRYDRLEKVAWFLNRDQVAEAKAELARPR